MFFRIDNQTAPLRLAVIAYDIACPKRARGVRKVLDALHHAKQYSVYELLHKAAVITGVLAELDALMAFPQDRLAVWWPWEGLRLVWAGEQLMVEARCGQLCREAVKLPQNMGNFIVCYDISCPDALAAVATEIAPEAAMVQRSVYWVRMPAGKLAALLRRCACYLEENDRLWAYPLRGSQALWHVGATASILPIATYRWENAS